MQKIFNAIAVASGVLTLTIIGAGIYGYKYITSDNFRKDDQKQSYGRYSESSS